jgi:uncharacterized delta-60 repeat protein
MTILLLENLGKGTAFTCAKRLVQLPIFVELSRFFVGGDNIMITNKTYSGLLVALLFLAVIQTRTQAAPGDIDQLFGDSGIVITDYLGLNNYGYDVAVQGDGRIIVVGSSYFTALRYLSNGVLDPSFGNGGISLTNLSSGEAFSVALQSDGNIVIAGYASVDGHSDSALLRLNYDGSLDGTFGSNGQVITNFGENDNNDKIVAVAIQPDGKIVAAGYDRGVGNFQQHYSFTVIRYNSNGSLDQDFGVNGKVSTDFINDTGLSRANDMILQPDGRIIVVGDVVDEGKAKFGIARYNSDGTLDLSFGINGLVLTDLGENTSAGASTVLIQSDQKIVVGGNIGESGYENRFGLVRYNVDGSIDTSFGNDGIALDDETSGFSSHSVILQSDGKILAGGHFYQLLNYYPYWDFGIVRFTSDGNLDQSFGEGGKITSDFGHAYEIGGALTITQDGNLLLVGRTKATHSDDYDYALVGFQSEEINNEPIAEAGNDQIGNEGDSLIFDGSNSTDPNGVEDIVSYEWDFGDGFYGSEI